MASASSAASVRQRSVPTDFHRTSTHGTDFLESWSPDDLDRVFDVHRRNRPRRARASRSGPPPGSSTTRSGGKRCERVRIERGFGPRHSPGTVSLGSIGIRVASVSVDHLGEHRLRTETEEILVLDQIDRIVFDATERQPPPRRVQQSTTASRHHADPDRFGNGPVRRKRSKQQLRECSIPVVRRSAAGIAWIDRTFVARPAVESTSDPPPRIPVDHGIGHPLEPTSRSFAYGAIDVDPRLDEEWFRHPDASPMQLRGHRECQPSADRISDQYRRARIAACRDHFGDVLGDQIESVRSSITLQNRPATIEIEIDRLDVRPFPHAPPDMTKRRFTVEPRHEEHGGTGSRIDHAS